MIVYQGKKKIEFVYRGGNSLLQELRKQNIFIDTPCSGNGTCGKCKVRFIEKKPKAGEEDSLFFSNAELEKGMRLACCVHPSKDAVIEIVTGEREFSVITRYQEWEKRNIKNPSEQGKSAIAIDLGTTTLAMQLLSLDTQTVLDTYTSLNRQRKYGADVISRIQASNSGKREELCQIIRTDLKIGVLQLLEQSKEEITQIVIAGNTTMIHLLMNCSCEGLAEFPFKTAYGGSIKTNAKELFGEDIKDILVTIFPHIAAFVGGDISAGLLACNFFKEEKINFLLDLGTNGEMAIGNKDKLLVTSTAAGPAFEGGNIKHGTGSVVGAISKVTIKKGEANSVTIGNKEPCGICGTGVIETIYELRKEKIMDETGLLAEPYFEQGFLLTQKTEEQITLTQKDIREVQLAKAAIFAGIKILTQRFGIKEEDISNFYVAGGFGYFMNIEKAIGIGLIPECLKEKIKVVGNTSLEGAVKVMQDIETFQMVEKYIREKATEVTLANDGDFQEEYINNMNF